MRNEQEMLELIVNTAKNDDRICAVIMNGSRTNPNAPSDAGYENTLNALETICNLFRQTAVVVADHFGFDYLYDDDKRVSAHLKYVRLLPRDALEMY